MPQGETMKRILLCQNCGKKYDQGWKPTSKKNLLRLYKRAAKGFVWIEFDYCPECREIFFRKV